jgi:hypothetical protein
MSVSWSKTTIPPWPRMPPAFANSSKQIGVLSSFSGKIDPSGPPT